MIKFDGNNAPGTHMNKSTGIGFDALFNNASMGIVVTNEQGIIVLANPFLLKQFGYNGDELISQSIEKLIPARFHSKHIGHVHEYNKHPKSRPMGLGMDLFARRKDGSEFAVEVSLGSYETQQGKFTIAFLSDISLRKEAELALMQLNSELESKVEERTLSLSSTVKQLAHQIQETEAKDAELKRVNNFLSNIWQHAGAIIFVTDKDGIIKMFNPAAEKQLGYPAAEIVGHKTPDMFYDINEQGRAKELPLFAAGLKLAGGNDVPNEYQVNYVRNDGTSFPVSLTITAMRDIYGITDGYLGIAIDISERIKAEMDLRTALEKEKELSELKSRFVSMASHEFRTPLSTVLSSIYLISKYTEAEDQPRREKHVERIVSSVNLLTDVLNDFLSVGKIEEGKIQVRRTFFNVPHLLRSTINEMNGLLKSGQQITLEYSGDEDAYLDPGLLKHIVMNLLSNAVKFSPENATVTLCGKSDNSRLELLCSDEGVGIPEEDQHHLFERFFRGTNVSHIQGTGLGLHIVSKYAELMSGSVSCNSKLGEGTTFCVLFDTRINENTESHVQHTSY